MDSPMVKYTLYTVGAFGAIYILDSLSSSGPTLSSEMIDTAFVVWLVGAAIVNALADD